MSPNPTPALRHVLLVDDEHAFVDALRLYLRRRGWTVTASHSPQEALAQLERHGDIAVVVTDVRLAAQDGLELARRIVRDCTGGRAVAVVVVTGHGELATGVSADPVPGPPVLRKPLGMPCFLETLEAALARAHDAGRTAEGPAPAPAMAGCAAHGKDRC